MMFRWGVSLDLCILILLLVLLSGVLALASRRALRLARRSRVGAESEADVRRALEPLANILLCFRAGSREPLVIAAHLRARAGPQDEAGRLGT